MLQLQIVPICYNVFPLGLGYAVLHKVDKKASNSLAIRLYSLGACVNIGSPAAKKIGVNSPLFYYGGILYHC